MQYLDITLRELMRAKDETIKRHAQGIHKRIVELEIELREKREQNKPRFISLE